MNLQFLNKHIFTHEYQRNNKAKGRKNLRCFPACREHGHVDTGYCGRPVTVELAHHPESVRGLDLVAFAEFRPINRSESNVSVGQVYRLDEVLRFSRGVSGSAPSDAKALNPWFPGSVVGNEDTATSDDGKITFAFNQTNQGWHYAWQSHRMTRDTKHCLHVFVLAGNKQNSDAPFTVIAESTSDPFQIYCRRKRVKSPGTSCCQSSHTSNHVKAPKNMPWLKAPPTSMYTPRITTPPRMPESDGSPPEPHWDHPMKKQKMSHHLHMVSNQPFSKLSANTAPAPYHLQHDAARHAFSLPSFGALRLPKPGAMGLPPMQPNPSQAKLGMGSCGFDVCNPASGATKASIPEPSFSHHGQAQNDLNVANREYEFSALIALASLAGTR